MKRLRYLLMYGIIMVGIISFSVNQANAREIIHLTLNESINVVMGKSYRIKQLQLGIERTRYRLKARQASLKSRVYMNLKAPEYEAVSDYKWNSTLKKDEIIRQNTRLWQMDLAIQQPVILFGYPTNGYLSLNNKVYKYTQQDGISDVNFYNRYYIKYEQPFFLPNELKNDIEEAELDLEMEELEFIRDRVWLIDRVADDYYDLFEFTYYNTIYTGQIASLNIIAEIAVGLAAQDTIRLMDKIQVQVELANVQETMLKNNSALRRQEMESKQRLRLAVEDSVYVTPTIEFKPIVIETDHAIKRAFSLRPTLRMLDIEKREQEIDLNNSKGWDAFHVNLEMTYGLEKQDDRYQSLWDEYDNSYSASLNAYVPIWDWGRRKARIEAERIGVEQTELEIEENQYEIRSEIINTVENLMEYQKRTINMMGNKKMVQEITDVSIGQYKSGTISLQDLLQIVNRQSETEINFLEAFQGYRRSLHELMMRTYYDYENDISLIDKFRPES